MTGRASDAFCWAPLEMRGELHRPYLLHFCPTACVMAPTTREQLDPMALGTCRYCGERLALSPTPEAK